MPRKHTENGEADSPSWYEERQKISNLVASKSVFTTGQIARILTLLGHETSHLSVIRAVDENAIPGRRIPGSKHRRIDKPAFLRWLGQRNIPTEDIDQKTIRLVREKKRRDNESKKKDIYCSDTFTLGQLLVEHPVSTIVIGEAKEKMVEIRQLIADVCAKHRYPLPKIIWSRAKHKSPLVTI